MAELIPYNVVPIPEPGPTLEEMGPQIELVRRLEVPGIIIPHVDVDTSAAMDRLNPIFAACGVTILHSVSPREKRGTTGDQPIHIDSIPIDHDVTGMVVQHTRVGTADIILAKLAEPFCKELRERNAHITLDNHANANYDLPPGTNELFDKGLVDPDVIRPDVFVGSIAAGGTIAFTFGGQNPIAHRFKTTSPERHVQGHIASFARLEA